MPSADCLEVLLGVSSLCLDSKTASQRKVTTLGIAVSESQINAFESLDHKDTCRVIVLLTVGALFMKRGSSVGGVDGGCMRAPGQAIPLGALPTYSLVSF